MISVGVDIGGTNIACCIVNEEGEILEKGTVPFPRDGIPEHSVLAVGEIVSSLLAKCGFNIKDAGWIGIAVPGSIAYESGVIIDAHNLNYHDFPLKERLSELFPQTKLYIENDANAAALAEYHSGAFRGHQSGVLITLGTGVGGGAIVGGRLFTGGMKNGFELGHMVLQHDGISCNCSNVGCAETLCSASALIREGVQAMRVHPESLIAQKAEHDEGRIDAKLLFDCANAGDAIANALIDDYIRALGSLVTSIIALFDPEVIAIGGGVSNAGERLLAPLRAYVAPRAFFRRFGAIVKAEMGNDAGMFGAAMLGK